MLFCFESLYILDMRNSLTFQRLLADRNINLSQLIMIHSNSVAITMYLISYMYVRCHLFNAAIWWQVHTHAAYKIDVIVLGNNEGYSHFE